MKCCSLVVGGKVDLGALVEDENLGYRSVMIGEPFVQARKGRQVVAQSVLAASHLLERDGACGSVGDDAELTQVQTHGGVWVLEGERLGFLGDLLVDQRQTVVDPVGWTSSPRASSGLSMVARISSRRSGGRGGGGAMS